MLFCLLKNRYLLLNSRYIRGKSMENKEQLSNMYSILLQSQNQSKFGLDPVRFQSISFGPNCHNLLLLLDSYEFQSVFTTP